MRSRRGEFKGAGSVPGQALVHGHGKICNYLKRMKKLFKNVLASAIVGYSVLRIET